MTGRTFGMRRRKLTAATPMAVDAWTTRTPRWCMTKSMCRWLLPAGSSTSPSTFAQRLGWSTTLATFIPSPTWSISQPLDRPSTTTASRATPTGTSDGPHTRSHGVAVTCRWDAPALGTAAIICTPMSSLRESAISMVVSTTAVLASPTGCRAGLIPRRTGAATRRAGAVSSSTAALAMQLGCDVWLLCSRHGTVSGRGRDVGRRPAKLAPGH